MNRMTRESAMVDLVGIGFGPSNLALSLAISEHNEATTDVPLRARFFDNKSSFQWHPDMMLPGAQMQVSFLKDLVTLRNPLSPATFINYLKCQGRLVDFINHQTFFPSRAEFSDYLGWAASKVSDQVSFESTVSSVRADGDHFVVSVRDNNGHSHEVAARNVVIGGGITGALPDHVTPSVRQWHSHNLLSNLDKLPELTHRRFVVVGAGQSAAEVTSYLHDTYVDAEVHSVFAKYGYTPADDSPFANRVFDPDAVDDFHSASPQVRQQLMTYHKSTNYSAVDSEVINDLYAREYQEKVSGRRRLFVRGASRLDPSRIIETDSGVQATICHLPTGTPESVTADAIVYATGFRSVDLTHLLGDTVDDYCFDEAGMPVVTRDYRVERKGNHPGSLYLHGGVEHSHGLTSTLLSNIAVRSGEIVESIANPPMS